MSSARRATIKARALSAGWYLARQGSWYVRDRPSPIAGLGPVALPARDWNAMSVRHLDGDPWNRSPTSRTAARISRKGMVGLIFLPGWGPIGTASQSTRIPAAGTDGLIGDRGNVSNAGRSRRASRARRLLRSGIAQATLARAANQMGHLGAEGHLPDQARCGIARPDPDDFVEKTRAVFRPSRRRCRCLRPHSLPSMITQRGARSDP